MSFQIGDVVIVTFPAATQKCQLINKVGTIKHIKDKEAGEHIGVEFSEDVGGHDLSGHCQKPYGYYMRSSHLKKMEPLAVLLQKQWKKEWEPKLRKEITHDLVILVNEDDT